jgi:hypothetical protein
LGAEQGFDADAFDEATLAVRRLQTSEATCGSLGARGGGAGSVTLQRIGWRPSKYGLGHNLQTLLAEFSYSFNWHLASEFVDPSTDENNPVWHFANNSFCQNEHALGWDCYFESLTTCANATSPSCLTDALDQFDEAEQGDVLLLEGYEKHGVLWTEALLIGQVSGLQV